MTEGHTQLHQETVHLLYNFLCTLMLK